MSMYNADLRKFNPKYYKNSILYLLFTTNSDNLQLLIYYSTNKFTSIPLHKDHYCLYKNKCQNSDEYIETKNRVLKAIKEYREELKDKNIYYVEYKAAERDNDKKLLFNVERHTERALIDFSMISEEDIECKKNKSRLSL